MKGWENSVSQMMYSDANKKIEFGSWLFYIFVTNISSLAATVPNVFLTLYNYFVLDLGDESYYFAMPLM